MSVIQFPVDRRREGLTDPEVQDVVAFPSEPRQAVVPRLEGLMDREVSRVVAWCAANEILGLAPVPGTAENGARCVGLHDDSGYAKWTVCRERGNLAVFDGDCKVVPRGTSRAVESLWEALTADHKAL